MQSLCRVAIGGTCQRTPRLHFFTKRLRLCDCIIAKVHFSIRSREGISFGEEQQYRQNIFTSLEISDSEPGIHWLGFRGPGSILYVCMHFPGEP